jgi:predicted RNase H-like HicB family nuclease
MSPLKESEVGIEQRMSDEQPSIENYEIIWSDEDGGYIAMSPEHPGISAFGLSIEDAIEQLRISLGHTKQQDREHQETNNSNSSQSV